MDVGVLGAGGLGQGIAQVCALAGHDVGLYDSEATDVMDGIDAVERALGEGGDASVDADSQIAGATDRLDGTTDLEGVVANADVVIETRADDTDTLREYFAAVEELAPPDALLATGRETGRVTAAAAGLRRPERAIGLYFFEPPSVSLVEVVAADQTTPAAAEKATAFVEELGFTWTLVRDVPGGVIRRLLLVQEVEAMRLVNDGVAGVEAVDAAMAVAHDLETGPLERADRAGLRDRLSALETLTEAVGDRFAAPPVLRDLVTAGHTGRSSGQGFYEWDNGRPAGTALPDPEIPHTTTESREPTR